MSMNISAWSIKSPIPSLVLFTVLVLLGVLSFGKLPITRFPNVDIPIVSVTVTQSGAAPTELETQVTKKVEDAVAGVSGVKHISSAISDGSSISTIEFRLEVNSDRALNNVKDAIAKIRSDLPRSIASTQACTTSCTLTKSRICSPSSKMSGGLPLSMREANTAATPVYGFESAWRVP